MLKKKEEQNSLTEGSDTAILIRPTKADIDSEMLDMETLEDEAEDAAITSRVAEYRSGGGQNR